MPTALTTDGFSCFNLSINRNVCEEGAMEQTYKLLLPVLWVFILILVTASPVYAATVKIGGTGFGLEMIRILGDAYRKNHPEAVFVIPPSLGSSGGIKALMAGALDIAISSRPLKEHERAQSLQDVAFFETPFVLAADPQVDKKSISINELEKIYRGEIKSWPDGSRLRLVLRPKIEADTKMLIGLSPEMGAAVTAAHKKEGLILQVNDQDNALALTTTPGALGFASLCQILTERLKLNVLAFNNLTPSIAALADGSYPLSKTLYLVTTEQLSPQALNFLAFIVSDQAKEILSSYGNLPLAMSHPSFLNEK